MMLAYRLVRAIEAHADELAQGLIARLNACGQCPDLHKVPPQELQQRVREIYGEIGEWLLHKTEAEIGRRYVEIGRRRFAQGLRASQVVFILVIVKEHLWEFLKKEVVVERQADVFGELEMLQLLEQFFDKAMHYAVLGYERAQAEAARGVAS